ncbi:hypothetical protein P3551_23830 [Vibrio parahaemolyticus]|nr:MULTISPECIES: hypothetical protein [Vibrio]EIA1497064.1 hypothetical protein [Vibrio parahaemolyticus]ELA7323050.1 hypothetical protein [Vibrio parahaemolyticus]ELI0612266.1 hypothetical protein [Vibrio vulnificus]MBE3803119.1 hypothetical protein [Vibrio parahaemolyticus]MBE3830580.1 hypothetical protein [Vibrio parahaemolyticus]
MLELEKYLEKLERTDREHIKYAQRIMEADGSKMYPLDFLFLAAVNRSKCNLHAFIHLIKERNYISAAPFLRMQVDSILRLAASTLVDDPHEFANKVLSGESVSKIKSRDNQKLQDWYLLKTFSPKFPWMEGVYKNCSGFIHLSEKHIHGIISQNDENGGIGVSISHEQAFIPEQNYLEAVAAFYESIDSLFNLCRGWILSKEYPEEVSQLMSENMPNKQFKSDS